MSPSALEPIDEADQDATPIQTRGRKMAPLGLGIGEGVKEEKKVEEDILTAMVLGQV